MSPAVLIVVALVVWWLFNEPPDRGSSTSSPADAGPPPVRQDPQQYYATDRNVQCPPGLVPAWSPSGPTCVEPPYQNQQDATSVPTGYAAPVASGSSAPVASGSAQPASGVGFGQAPPLEAAPTSGAGQLRTLNKSRGGRGGFS